MFRIDQELPDCLAHYRCSGWKSKSRNGVVIVSKSLYSVSPRPRWEKSLDSLPHKKKLPERMRAWAKLSAVVQQTDMDC